MSGLVEALEGVVRRVVSALQPTPPVSLKGILDVPGVVLTGVDRDRFLNVYLASERYQKEAVPQVMSIFERSTERAEQGLAGVKFLVSGRMFTPDELRELREQVTEAVKRRFRSVQDVIWREREGVAEFVVVAPGLPEPEREKLAAFAREQMDRVEIGVLPVSVLDERSPLKTMDAGAPVFVDDVFVAQGAVELIPSEALRIAGGAVGGTPWADLGTVQFAPNMMERTTMVLPAQPRWLATHH